MTELTIKGDVEVLRLQPGDTIVVTIDRPISRISADVLKDQVERQFPGHTVVIANGVRLSAQREDAA